MNKEEIKKQERRAYIQMACVYGTAIFIIVGLLIWSSLYTVTEEETVSSVHKRLNSILREVLWFDKCEDDKGALLQLVSMVPKGSQVIEVLDCYTVYLVLDQVKYLYRHNHYSESITTVPFP